MKPCTNDPSEKTTLRTACVNPPPLDRVLGQRWIALVDVAMAKAKNVEEVGRGGGGFREGS